MRLRVWMSTLAAFALSGGALAADFDRSELPDSAYTAGKGTFQIHADGYHSSVGVTDFIDIRTRILPSYFGPNLAAKIGAIQEEDWALSFEPSFWAEWPMAKLGSPSYSLGVLSRYSRSFGKHRFNFGVGFKYDVIKVTIRPVNAEGEAFDPDAPQAVVADKGIQINYEYSVTLLHAPMHFHQNATKTEDGWDFSGIRMPIIVGYELHTQEGEAFNFVARIRPLAIANGGSWYAEIHPSYNKTVGDKFRFSFGVNILAPGMPFPIADEEVNNEIESHQDTNQEDVQKFMNKVPMAGWPVFVIPTIGLWWQI
jgi:hypothetical protein